MSFESGKFVCPRCHKDPFENYKKWKKNEKWIFFYFFQGSRSFWRSHKSHYSQEYVSSHSSYGYYEDGQLKYHITDFIENWCNNDYLNDNPETVWITSGGSTEQEWMSIWLNERLSYCFRCNYKSSSFI